MNDKSQIVLSCHGLSKKFVEGKTTLQILDDLEFSITEGEMVAIVGVSGAGKSTFLHLLGGLDQATSGHVLIDGKNLTNLNENEKGHLRNDKLGFVYQFHHLLPEFNALENVCMPLLIRGIKASVAIQEATAMMARVGLVHRLKHRIGELSGGERQRTAIARALVTQPRCVLADEPTGNLDQHTALHVFELMQKLNKEFRTSFVIVTHNEELAAKMDKIYVLEHGKLKLEMSKK